MQGGRPPQPSATNSPSSSRALHGRPVGVRQSKRCATARVARSAPWAAREPRGSAPRERDHGGGDRPVPFRTRKLSPPSPKVLRGSPREDRASRSRRALFCSEGRAPPAGGRPGASAFFARGGARRRCAVQAGGEAAVRANRGRRRKHAVFVASLNGAVSRSFIPLQ